MTPALRGRSSGWLLPLAFLLLSACPKSHKEPTEEEMLACTTSADCVVSNYCRGCATCINRATRFNVDCQAVCRIPPGAACACVGGRCERADTPAAPVNAPTAPDTDRLQAHAADSLAKAATDAPPMGLTQPQEPPSPNVKRVPSRDLPFRHFLLLRDGSQCTLQDDEKRVEDTERYRLEGAGLVVKQVHVAFMLRSDVIPADCVPANEDSFFEQHPYARAGLKKAGGIVCEACGCPEPWYFCAEAANTDEEMRQAGYAPVGK